MYLQPMQQLTRPGLDEVHPFYQGYLNTAEGDNLFDALDLAESRLRDHLHDITELQAGFRYAPGKWSIKEVLQHVLDTERIFAYRALCFARGEQQPLAGFDENAYASLSNADHRPWSDLLTEHAIMRASTLALFQSFTPEMLVRSGTANERTFTVRALGWTIAGHELHHLHILQTRYHHGRS